MGNMTQARVRVRTRCHYGGRTRLLLTWCGLVLLLLAGCDASNASTDRLQERTFIGASSKPITYSTNPHDVLIRTFYGGGLYGTLALYPDISVYGDGTYILEGTRQGKLSTEQLQTLLGTLVDKYTLPALTRHTFIDIPDQNATYLEFLINGKQHELIYGPFGHMQESAQDLSEYQKLGDAIKAVTETLKGRTRPYRQRDAVLLVRQLYSPDLTKTIPRWLLSDFSLAQAAAYECGLIPVDETSSNAETACLKYTIPRGAILLNAMQRQIIQGQLQGEQGTFIEQEVYYRVEVRPLLPDEQARKMLAMFGSAQDSYRRITLLQGTVPPVPTPTPET
jgi:hypothetical protein